MGKLKGDLTVGNPMKLIILFAIPILIGNIFQQLYNATDTIVVGHFLGDNALAAVGATGAICTVIFGFSSGLENGFSVVIAKHFGEKRIDKMHKAIAGTIMLTGIIAIVITLLGLFGIRPLLEFLDTPKSIINRSAVYLYIVMGFVVVTLAYNMFAAMLRAIGNSKAPLYFLIISTVLNIFLDFLFISAFKMGVSGVAVATVLAQGVSVLCCIWYVRKKCPLLHISKSDFKVERKMIWDLLTTSLSMAFMIAIVCVGSVALQKAVNSFGETTIAAHQAARKIDDIFMLPISTLAISAATFASQNLGAGKLDRVKKGMFSALELGIFWSLLSTVYVVTLGEITIRLVTGSHNEFLIETALDYIQFDVPFFPVLCLLVIGRSSLQGVGRKVIPLVASFIELFLKFIAAFLLAPFLGYIGVCITEPIIWTACGIFVFVDFICVFRKKNCISNTQTV